MSNFMGRLKRATKAAFEGGGATQYAQKGQKIACPQCGNDRFEEGSAQLNTAGMTALNLDWANRSATLLVCSQCSRIDWYMDRPERI